MIEKHYSKQCLSSAVGYAVFEQCCGTLCSRDDVGYRRCSSDAVG